eukprot:TRINITY_DN4094_c0_g1_i1.p1 TRINITY_DN4094_c0_g1~~TRINITY_DN4094_c0_g1_i1.p1  ORF type:complete len:434 (+),score=112.26 TRINITY_DN4094_c0_g1_i1:63-1364(+)
MELLLQIIAEEVGSSGALAAVAAASGYHAPVPRVLSRRMTANWSSVTDHWGSWGSESVPECAVIVNDLTGLTRNTRKHGVIHTSAVIVRMRQLALPVVHRYGVQAVAYEGDNMFALLPTVRNAVQAVYEMKALWSQWNESLSEDRQHYKIGLSGLAVGWGRAAEKGGHVGGPGFQSAYKLAEDIAKDGQILIAKDAAEKCRAELPGVTLEPLDDPEADGAFVFTPSDAMKEALSKMPPAAPCDDDSLLHANLVPFAKLCAAEADVGAVSDDIRKRFARQSCCALMFRVSLEASAAEARDAITAVRDVFRQPGYGVILCEDIGVVPQRDLFFFETAVGAVQAGIAAKRIAPPKVITGWGVHMGEVLLVPGTDVHWGDPVNTASKVGQDLAEFGEMLLTAPVYEAVREHVSSVKYEERKLRASGVDFIAQSVIIL